MFLKKLLASGRSLMVVALMYEMQLPCNFFTLSLSGSDSHSSNSWRDNNDGDHDDASMMEIMSTR